MHEKFEIWQSHILIILLQANPMNKQHSGTNVQQHYYAYIQYKNKICIETALVNMRLK